MLPGLGAYLTEEDSAESNADPEVPAEDNAPLEDGAEGVVDDSIRASATGDALTSEASTGVGDALQEESAPSVPRAEVSVAQAVVQEEVLKKKRKRKRTTSGLPPPSFKGSALPAPFSSTTSLPSPGATPAAKKQRKSPLRQSPGGSTALVPPQLRGSRPNTVTEDMTKYYSSSWTAQKEKTAPTGEKKP